jgi:predicted PurR-regulated permease PerM
MKRIALLTSIILLTLTVIVIAWQLRGVLLLFILSLAIVATLDEPINWLIRRDWPRNLAILTVYLVAIGGLLGLVAAIFMPTVNELDPLVQALFGVYEWIQTQLLNLSGTRPTLATQLPSSAELTAWLAERQGEATLVQTLLGLTQNVGSVLGQLVLAVVVAIYWTADRLRFERLWLSLLAPEHRVRARKFWRKLEQDVGAYIRSEVLQAVLAGGLLTLGYWLLGVQFPFTLALLGALAWLVPLVGGVVALVPAVVIGWLSGPLTALAAVAYTVAVFALMEFYVERHLYTHERYWGVLVVLVMLALGDAFGLVGLLAAPPVAVALQSGLNELLDTPAPPVEAITGLDLTEFHARLDMIRGRVHDPAATSSPRLTNLVERLDQLMLEVEKTAAA